MDPVRLWPVNPPHGLNLFSPIIRYYVTHFRVQQFLLEIHHQTPYILFLCHELQSLSKLLCSLPSIIDQIILKKQKTNKQTKKQIRQPGQPLLKVAQGMYYNRIILVARLVGKSGLFERSLLSISFSNITCVWEIFFFQFEDEY